MPFTPFHLGIGLLLFAILPFLDPLALFIGTIIPDIEGILSLFVFPGVGLPLHGPLHSFAGAIILGSITGIVSYLVIYFLPETAREKLKIHPSLKISLVSAFTGTISHIVLDLPLYPEMNPFYPFLAGNPFLGIVDSSIPYIICIASFLLGTLFIVYRLLTGEKKD